MTVTSPTTGAHNHRTVRQVVEDRVAAVIERLDVALSFTTVDTWVAAQVLHAVEFAQVGPPGRDDDDWLPGIEYSESLALVRALLPFIKAARARPGYEFCAEHDAPRGADT